MKVLSLINGSLISQTATVYALYYAKNLNYKLFLVFIRNKKDSLEEVENSVEELKNTANEIGVRVEFSVFENLDEFKEYVEKEEIDIIFCSTRHQHSILDKSFVKKIIKHKIKADLAVVKVVKMGYAQSLEKIILPIRESKLSVKKFSFFVNMLKSYNAKGEIYSVEKVSPLEFKKTALRGKLRDLIFKLRHYFRLLKIMDMKISIKYANAISEKKSIKAHIAKYNFDLTIIGGFYDKKIFITNHPIYTFFKHPITNTIYFIPYEE